MNKRILLVCSVSLLTSFTVFSQEQAVAKHPISSNAQVIPVLKMQAEKIREKETQLDRATNVSRAQYAQLKDELYALNKEYLNLLSKEIALCSNESQRRVLEAELHYVEQQLTPVSNQR